MSVSVFPAPATGGATGGMTTDIFPISGGISLVQKTFPLGLYAFKAQSSTVTEASGTVEFRDADENVLASVTLVDSNTGGTSSPYFGALDLPQEAAFMFFSGANFSGFLEMSYSTSEGLKKIAAITTTASYVLPYSATAYVFGGGGAGGGAALDRSGGGGGGSGYLATGSVTPGTYSVVIGAGGLRSAETRDADGLAGGTSSFGDISASGGDGGLRSATTAGGANGGDGGCGGGGGRPDTSFSTSFGVGGEDGADGADHPGATVDRGLGGTGSGVAFSGGFFLPTSEASPTARFSGIFYAGGNGGSGSSNLQANNALANTAAGGGGGSRTSGTSGADPVGRAGTGGSGVIYLVEA